MEEALLDGVDGAAAAKAQRSIAKLKKKLQEARDACSANRNAAIAWKEKHMSSLGELEAAGGEVQRVLAALHAATADLHAAETRALNMERSLVNGRAELASLERQHRTLQVDYREVRLRAAEAAHLADPTPDSIREVKNLTKGARNDKERYAAAWRFAARQYDRVREALVSADEAQADRATAALELRQQRQDRAVAERRATEARAENRDLKSKLASLAGQLLRAQGQLREHGIGNTGRTRGHAKLPASSSSSSSDERRHSLAPVSAAPAPSTVRITPVAPVAAIGVAASASASPLPPQGSTPDEGGNTAPPSPPSSVASCNSSVILVATPSAGGGGTQQQTPRGHSASDADDATDVDSDSEGGALPTGTSMDLSAAEWAVAQRGAGGGPMQGLPTVSKARFKRKDALASALNSAVFSPALDFSTSASSAGAMEPLLEAQRRAPAPAGGRGSAGVGTAAAPPSTWLAAHDGGLTQSDDWLEAALGDVPVLTATASRGALQGGGADAPQLPSDAAPPAAFGNLYRASSTASSSASTASGTTGGGRKRSRGPVFSASGDAAGTDAKGGKGGRQRSLSKPREGPSNPFKASRFTAQQSSTRAPSQTQGRGVSNVTTASGTSTSKRIPRASAATVSTGNRPSTSTANKGKTQSRLASGVGGMSAPRSSAAGVQGGNSAGGHAWRRGVGPSSDGYFYSNAAGETDHVGMDLSIHEQLHGNGRLGWG